MFKVEFIFMSGRKQIYTLSGFSSFREFAQGINPNGTMVFDDVAINMGQVEEYRLAKGGD